MRFNNILLFVFIFIFFSCATNKVDETHTITDGLQLRYELRTKDSGWLFINEKSDSIPFRYEIIKSKREVIDGKSLKKHKISWYEYKIDYKGNISQYPILSKFKSLPSLSKKKVFIYKSAN